MRRSIVAIMLLCGMAAALAQGNFADAYLQGEAYFQNGDYARAEPLFLQSLNSSPPKSRGAGVTLVSQQHGYYPEVYLALIYWHEQRYQDVLTYAAKAKQYVRSNDPMYLQLASAENEAKRALANPAQGNGNGSRSVTLADSGGSGGSAIAGGRMYALVIGIDHYDDGSFPTLSTAVSDATAVSALLADRFGFETQLLKDATRHQILAALDAYRRTTTGTASILIYYAGHGHYDTETTKAYWLPKDAESSSNANWISADDITSDLHALPARHVVVVSDSCYSGGLSRDADAAMTSADHDRYVDKAAQLKSRNLLASGANEPVSDGGGGADHSVFAAALLRGLGAIESDRFTAHELFQNYISVLVSGRSQQSPQYTPIRNSGDEGGDFVFYRRKPS